MIRAFESSDMDDVLNIWLEASMDAHRFVEFTFWKSKVDDMRKGKKWCQEKNGARLILKEEKNGARLILKESNGKKWCQVNF